MKKYLKYAAIGLAAIFILIQFIPVLRANPEVTREIQWDSNATRDLAQRACFDCHSNESVWPWYSYVAPVSWRVASHVDHGRSHLNFSSWDQPNEDVEHIMEVIHEGEMPLWDYLLLHPEADLSEAETQTLLNGLKQTLADDPPLERRGEPDQ